MLGETINIKAEVVGLGKYTSCRLFWSFPHVNSTGKTLAYTRVEIESLKSGKLLAFGQSCLFLHLSDSTEEN